MCIAINSENGFQRKKISRFCAALIRKNLQAVFFSVGFRLGPELRISGFRPVLVSL